MSVFIRNVVSCCPLKGRDEAVTRWTATSCVRAAALAASRTSQPKSPPTANKPLASAPPLQPSHSRKSTVNIFHIIDRKCPCFGRTRELLFLSFSWLLWLWIDIKTATAPSVGIQLQLHLQRNIFCVTVTDLKWEITIFLSFRSPTTFSVFFFGTQLPHFSSLVQY